MKAAPFLHVICFMRHSTPQNGFLTKIHYTQNSAASVSQVRVVHVLVHRIIRNLSVAILCSVSFNMSLDPGTFREM